MARDARYTDLIVLGQSEPGEDSLHVGVAPAEIILTGAARVNNATRPRIY